MTKRATRQVREGESKISGTRKPLPKLAVPSRGPSAALRGMVDTIRNREFSSREQALDFFIDSIVSKLEGDPASQRDMRGFLRLLVDTDPLLREELVQSVRIRS